MKAQRIFSAPGLPLDALGHLATKLLQHFVAIALLNNALHPPIEAVAVLIGQFLCDDNHDFLVLRNIVPLSELGSYQP
jgi:hypothetical protein